MIGISCQIEKGYYTLNQDYISIISRFGGVPLIIPPPQVNTKLTAKEIADNIDGLILSGGADIPPELYGETEINPHGNYMNKFKAEFDIELVKQTLSLKKPVLGICLGIQEINVALGGTLFQNVTGHRNKSHIVRVDKNSYLYRAIGRIKILTNSYHHQAIKELASDLKAVAWSRKDNLIEAVEHKSKEQFLIGVQWHPERKPDKNSEKLIKYFIDVCNHRKFISE